MKTIRIRVYPVNGWGSYVVSLEFPEFWDTVVYVNKWSNDNLLNVEKWEIVK